MESLVCRVCGHDHRCGEGEVCGICGHIDTVKRGFGSPVSVLNPPEVSEILPDFLYLGCFNCAMRGELLEAQGISRVLNTVAGHEYRLKKKFTCHSLPDGKVLPFDNAIWFLDQCEKDKARVLVYCMSGMSRSPAIVIAYLMRCKGWGLTQSCEWVKARRSSVELSPEVTWQLQEYEQKILENSAQGRPPLPLEQVFDPVESSPKKPVSNPPLWAEIDDPDWNDYVLNNFNERCFAPAATDRGFPGYLPPQKLISKAANTLPRVDVRKLNEAAESTKAIQIARLEKKLTQTDL